MRQTAKRRPAERVDYILHEPADAASSTATGWMFDGAEDMENLVHFLDRAVARQSLRHGDRSDN